MKTKDLQTKSTKELQKDLTDMRGNLVQISVDMRTKEVKNFRQIRLLKKDIARVLTVMAAAQSDNPKGEKQ